MIEVRTVCPLGATLGEGPVWIAKESALWFVDIKKRQVHRFYPERGELKSWSAPAQVAWVLPMADGGLLAGLQTGLHRFTPETGAFELLAAVEPALPGNRLNDATVGPDGRLWFSSMDDGEEKPSGHVYRADGHGIARLAGGMAIINGPAIGPDGRTLYYNDTPAGVMYASRITAEGGLADTRVFAKLAPTEGHPDGLAVDAEGCVWVSLFGGWGVRRYAPDGTLLRFVRFPVANVTKAAFGGPDLRTLYVTTAAKGLSEAERAAQPLAGHLFALDAGVAGQAGHEVAPFKTHRRYD
jgi:D-xylonolactonase